MAIFGAKPWVNPFGIMSIFRLFKLLVFRAYESGFFCSTISSKTFSWSIFHKKKVGEMAIFGPKPWVNPFEKMPTFLTL